MVVNYSSLGQRIRQERQKLNLTQEQLAEPADVTTAFIGHIERSERSLSLETLIKISNRLGVTVDYLLSDSYKPRDPQMTEELLQLLDNKSPSQKRALLDIMRTIVKYLPVGEEAQ